MPTCSACPAPIVWAKSPAGRNMPVDAIPLARDEVERYLHADSKHRPTLYWLDSIEGGQYQAHRYDPDGSERERELHLSHFATCPAASRFTGRNR